MKTVGCLFALLLWAEASASSTGTLFLRGHVPARSKVVVDPVRGSYILQTNAGRFALATVIKDAVDTRGFRVITVIPQ